MPNFTGKNLEITRRGFVGALSLALVGCRALDFGKRPKFALNPSTVMKFNLPLERQVRLAAVGGFRGLEPWLKDVRAADAQGKLPEIRRLAEDLGLEFINGIAFGAWSHPDAERRRKGIEETKRDMDMLNRLGCHRIAASLCGIHAEGAPKTTLAEIAERYAALLELGRREGVRPLLEYWGHSVVMNRPEDALKVVEMVKDPDCAILADVFHTFKGGGKFAAFDRLTERLMPVLHVNDYPGRSAKELTDADRVWPGDGEAPWKEILGALARADNPAPWFSLELFNQSYQVRTPEWTVRTAREKMSNVFG